MVCVPKLASPLAMAEPIPGSLLRRKLSAELDPVETPVAGSGAKQRLISLPPNWGGARPEGLSPPGAVGGLEALTPLLSMPHSPSEEPGSPQLHKPKQVRKNTPGATVPCCGLSPRAGDIRDPQTPSPHRHQLSTGRAALFGCCRHGRGA